MQVYMSAATVLGSTGVRAGVRHCGHDPIVGGKSSAKLGYKVKCPELGTCVGTEYQHYAHRTHSHSLIWSGSAVMFAHSQSSQEVKILMVLEHVEQNQHLSCNYLINLYTRWVVPMHKCPMSESWVWRFDIFMKCLLLFFEVLICTCDAS